MIRAAQAEHLFARAGRDDEGIDATRADGFERLLRFGELLA
jgi:hypothetical protein